MTQNSSTESNAASADTRSPWGPLAQPGPPPPAHQMMQQMQQSGHQPDQRVIEQQQAA